MVVVGGSCDDSRPITMLVCSRARQLSVVWSVWTPFETLHSSFLLEGKTARDTDGHCHVFLPANHVQDAVTGEWSKVCACGLKEALEVQ